MGRIRKVAAPPISTAEAAVRYVAVTDAGRQFFAVGPRRAYQLAASGDLPTVRVGGRLRVPVGADGGLIREVTR